LQSNLNQSPQSALIAFDNKAGSGILHQSSKQQPQTENTMNDFNRKTLRKLASLGIKLIGIQAIPDMASSMPYANASRGYVLDDNGTCRVRGFMEVLKLAGE